MEFTFETDYTRQTMTAVSRAISRTIHAKRNRNLRLMVLGLCAAFAIFGSWVELPWGFTGGMMAVLVAVLLFQDQIGGYVGHKMLTKGMEHMTVVFRQEDYETVACTGQGQWRYDALSGIVQTRDYIILLLGGNYAHALEKKTLSGGTMEEFTAFLTEKTGLTIQKI